SEALNYGISEALGDYFVCMDADSVLSKNILLEAIPYFEDDPNLAAVAGAVKVGNSKNILTAFQNLEYIIGLNFHKKAQSFLKMVTIVPGPIGVFNREKVYNLGGYSSDTFAEDSDLSMRLLMEGYNIKYCDKISAVTEAPDDINSLITQRYRWSRGMVQAIFKGIGILRGNYSFRGLLVILYMFFETIMIPLINFSFIVLTLEFALLYNITDLMGPYFIGLTLLDVALCFYSIITERKIGFLLILSFLNRLTYGLLLEVIRFFSIFDELLKVPMKWGVLVRKGLN
uniref:glycosyltransferase family 2 protein n=1 Tax=Halobacteriovorax sp. TaxID=2020862 RepID=UPI0035617322